MDGVDSAEGVSLNGLEVAAGQGVHVQSYAIIGHADSDHMRTPYPRLTFNPLKGNKLCMQEGNGFLETSRLDSIIRNAAGAITVSDTATQVSAQAATTTESRAPMVVTTPVMASQIPRNRVRQLKPTTVATTMVPTTTVKRVPLTKKEEQYLRSRIGLEVGSPVTDERFNGWASSMGVVKSPHTNTQVQQAVQYHPLKATKTRRLMAKSVKMPYHHRLGKPVKSTTTTEPLMNSVTTMKPLMSQQQNHPVTTMIPQELLSVMTWTPAMDTTISTPSTIGPAAPLTTTTPQTVQSVITKQPALIARMSTPSTTGLAATSASSSAVAVKKDPLVTLMSPNMTVVTSANEVATGVKQSTTAPQVVPVTQLKPVVGPNQAFTDPATRQLSTMTTKVKQTNMVKTVMQPMQVKATPHMMKAMKLTTSQNAHLDSNSNVESILQKHEPLRATINFGLSHDSLSPRPCIIDTGAGVSLMPVNYVPKGARIVDTSFTIIGANDCKVRPLGEVRLMAKAGTGAPTSIVCVVVERGELLLSHPDMVRLRLSWENGQTYDQNGLPLNTMDESTKAKILAKVNHSKPVRFSESDVMVVPDNFDETPAPSDNWVQNVFGEDVPNDDRLKLATLIEKMFGESSDYIPELAEWRPIKQTFLGEPQPAMPHALSQEQIVCLSAELTRLEKKGVLVKVDSDLDATIPAFLIRKRDQSWRLIADARGINSLTVGIENSLPSLEHILSTARGNYFAVVDIKSAYHTMTLDERDWRYFTIRDQLTSNLYAYRRLPMGCRNSPRYWTRALNNLLMPTIKKLKCKVHLYMDDCVVVSQTMSDHVETMTALLKRLISLNLRTNDKIRVGQRSVTVFGYELDATGRKPSPQKLKALHDLPRPETYGALTRYLCSLNYYRLSFPKWARYTCNLYSLAQKGKKNAKITWSSELNAEYEKVKNYCLNALNLIPFDPNKRVIITCDWSRHGSGAVIEQGNPAKPVFFYSKKNTCSESLYNSHLGELCALKNCLERFSYLLSNDTPILVKTDSQYVQIAILNGFKCKLLSVGRCLLLSTLLKLSTYNLTVSHNSGKSAAMSMADLLSRHGADKSRNVIFVMSRSSRDIPFTVKALEKVSDDKYEIVGVKNKNGGKVQIDANKVVAVPRQWLPVSPAVMPTEAVVSVVTRRMAKSTTPQPVSGQPMTQMPMTVPTEPAAPTAPTGPAASTVPTVPAVTTAQSPLLTHNKLNWEGLIDEVKAGQTDRSQSLATVRKIALLQTEPSLCRGHKPTCTKPECVKGLMYNRIKKRFMVKDGHLYITNNNEPRLYVPEWMTKHVLNVVHTSMNHVSALNTARALHAMGMDTTNIYRHALDVTLACEQCAESKQAKMEKTNLSNRPIPGGFAEDVSADVTQVGQGPTALYALIVCCGLTKFIWALSIKSHSALELRNAFATIISSSTIPFTLRTDNHPSWSSETFQELIRNFSIEHRKICPLNSRGNLAESAIKRWQAQMRKIPLDEVALSPSDWRLAVAICTIETNVDKDLTGESSYEKLWGQTPNHLYNAKTRTEVKTTSNQLLKKLHAQSEERLNTLIEKLRLKQKKNPNTHTKFQPGMLVKLRVDSKKFHRKFSKELWEIRAITKSNTAVIGRYFQDENETRRIPTTVRRIHTRLLKLVKPLPDIALEKEDQGPIVENNALEQSKDNIETASQLKPGPPRGKKGQRRMRKGHSDGKH